MSHDRKPTRNLDALSLTHNPPGAEKEKIKERAVPLSCEYDHIPTSRSARRFALRLLAERLSTATSSCNVTSTSVTSTGKPRFDPDLPPRPYYKTPNIYQPPRAVQLGSKFTY